MGAVVSHQYFDRLLVLACTSLCQLAPAGTTPESLSVDQFASHVKFSTSSSLSDDQQARQVWKVLPSSTSAQAHKSRRAQVPLNISQIDHVCVINYILY
jgi:hypothetical protein